MQHLSLIHVILPCSRTVAWSRCVFNRLTLCNEVGSMLTEYGSTAGAKEAGGAGRVYDVKNLSEEMLQLMG